MYEPGPALNMTANSPNSEIQRAAFDFALEAGYMIFSTTAADGKTPTARALEVHSLDDSGALYIGISKGKPVYEELMLYPFLVGMIQRATVNRLSISVRISAEVEPVSDPQLMARYWELNPGTKSLYRRDLENFKLFRLEKGEGEIFHVYAPDTLARVRFSFGDAVARPWHYVINENCTGCGACKDACLTQVILPQNSVYAINHYGCLECGKCYDVCPFNGIDKNY